MRIIRIGTSFLQFIKNKIRMILFWSYQTEYDNFQVPEKVPKFIFEGTMKHGFMKVSLFEFLIAAEFCPL